MTLHEFVDANRDELIGRCRAKVRQRSSPLPTETEIDRGVPLFLEQLVKELRQGPSASQEIHADAARQGHDLLVQGFTIGQVVHGYGDICQSITELAVELAAPISTEDFRTLNRCLDDAIASAVTEFARKQDAGREGESHHLESLATIALTAFEVLRTGDVGVGGSTGAVVYRSLTAIRAALIERQRAETTVPVTKPTAE